MTDAGRPVGSHNEGGVGLLVVLGILALFWTTVIVEVAKLL